MQLPLHGPTRLTLVWSGEQVGPSPDSGILLRSYSLPNSKVCLRHCTTVLQGLDGVLTLTEMPPKRDARPVYDARRKSEGLFKWCVHNRFHIVCSDWLVVVVQRL